MQTLDSTTPNRVRSLIWWGGGALATAIAAFFITRLLVHGMEAQPPQAEEVVEVVEVTPEVVFDPPRLTGPPRLSGMWEWVDLRGGECLAQPPTGESAEVTVVSCDGPHEARYLSPVLVSPDEEAPYPGDEELERIAHDNCELVTAQSVGVGPEMTDLVVTGLYLPDERSWQAGLRVVGCVVFREGGGLVDGDAATQDE